MGPPRSVSPTSSGRAWALVGELVRRRRVDTVTAAVAAVVVVVELTLRPVLVSHLAEAALVRRAAGRAGALAVAVTTAMLVGVVAEYVRSTRTAAAAEAALADLRVGTVRSGVRGSAHSGGARPAPLGAALNDTAVVARQITGALPAALGAVLGIGASMTALALLDVRLLAATAALLAVVLVPLTRWYRARMAPASDAFFARYDELVEALGESAAGAPVAWRFGREDLADRFDAPNRAEAAAYRAMVEISARYQPATAALRGLCTAAAVVVSALVVAPGERVRVLSGALVALPALFGALTELTDVAERITAGRAALARLAALDVLAAPAPVPAAPPGTATITARAVVRRLGRFTLGPVTLQLGPGVTALVGATGAGKSTLARVLSGLEEPEAGEVCIAGLPAPAALRAGVVGLLPQVPAGLPGTVGDNLRLARPAAPDPALAAELDGHGLGGWVRALPAGLATPLDDTLSDGDRHVVGLVQVLLRDPPVVVLDEPTATLDPMTALRVERASMAALAGRTVVLITHNLASARRADRIAVLAGGTLVGVGTHDELVADCAEYRRLTAAGS